MIVGHAGNADVLRLAGFLARNGHPHQQIDPDADASARTLIEGFHVDAEELPIVLCPNGRMLRNPSEVELATCLGSYGPSMRPRCTTWRSWKGLTARRHRGPSARQERFL